MTISAWHQTERLAYVLVTYYHVPLLRPFPQRWCSTGVQRCRPAVPLQPVRYDARNSAESS